MIFYIYFLQTYFTLQLSQRAGEIYNSFLSSKATMPVNIDSQAQLADDVLTSPRPDMFKTQQLQVQSRELRVHFLRCCNLFQLFKCSHLGSIQDFSHFNYSVVLHENYRWRYFLDSFIRMDSVCSGGFCSHLAFSHFAQAYWVFLVAIWVCLRKGSEALPER